MMSDAVTKEKSQGYLFRSVLKCIPFLIEEVGRSNKITEIVPQHGISIDPSVREEAVQVLNRIVRYLPDRRFAVIRGMANFIIQLPDEFPLLIQSSLGRLLELMRFWRACLLEDTLEPIAEYTAHMEQRNSGVKNFSSHHQAETIAFRVSEIDALGLIFLSSVDSQIRNTSLELLRCVCALRNDMHNLLIHDQSDYYTRYEVEPVFLIDVLEEHGVGFPTFYCMCFLILESDVCSRHSMYCRMTSFAVAIRTRVDENMMPFHLICPSSMYSLRVLIRASGLVVLVS